MHNRRPSRAALAAIAVWLVAAPLAAAAAEPPLHIVFPFEPGGSGDVLARLLAGKLHDSLKREVIVDDRPGSAGRTAIAVVKAAKPDGNTILLTPIAPMAVYPYVYSKLAYDPIKDFIAISQLCIFDFGIAAAPNVEAKTLPELVAWIKADASKAKYGVPALGTLPHFLGVLFSRDAGVAMRAVPYRGSAGALADAAAGNIPIVITTTADLIPAAKAGVIRVLATSGNGRSPFLPNVPTLRESGYKLSAIGWYGVFALAGTPAEEIARLNKAMVEAVRAREVEPQLLAVGLQPTGTTAAGFAKIVKDSSELWGPAVKASEFPVQD